MQGQKAENHTGDPCQLVPLSLSKDDTVECDWGLIATIGLSVDRIARRGERTHTGVGAPRAGGGGGYIIATIAIHGNRFPSLHTAKTTNGMCWGLLSSKSTLGRRPLDTANIKKRKRLEGFSGPKMGFRAPPCTRQRRKAGKDWRGGFPTEDRLQDRPHRWQGQGTIKIEGNGDLENLAF